MSTQLHRAIDLLRTAGDVLARGGAKPDAAEQAWRWAASALIAEVDAAAPADVETIELHGDAAWEAFVTDNELSLFDSQAARACASTPEGWIVGGGAAPLYRVRLHPSRAA